MEEANIKISAMKFVKYFIGITAAQLGITLSPSWEILIISAVGSLILAGYNYLSHKYPIIKEWVTIFSEKKE